MVASNCPRQFTTKSSLSYCGGKARIVELLRHYRPETMRELREPFVGGGSFYFEVGFTCERAWLNDMHDGLMAFYEALRDRPEEFIAKCRAIAPARLDDPMTGRGPHGGEPKNARLKGVFDLLKSDETCDQALRYFFINRTNFGSGRVNYDIPNRQCFGSSRESPRYAPSISRTLAP
jgi:site-specific DNA-adenine methylase